MNRQSTFYVVCQIYQLCRIRDSINLVFVPFFLKYYAKVYFNKLDMNIVILKPIKEYNVVKCSIITGSKVESEVAGFLYGLMVILGYSRVK